MTGNEGNPDLYLSLLSGQLSSASASNYQRYNNIGSRLSGHPFPNDPDRLMDLLDALAAICVRKETGQVFFVSLSMHPNAVTLFVSSNETVPVTVTSHVQNIRGQLKALRSVVESETSPDPNNTDLRADGELVLQQTIYEYSWAKLQRRFLKRAPAVFVVYDSTIEKLKTLYKIADDDIDLLHTTHNLLHKMDGLLQNKRPPQYGYLRDVIHTIVAMSLGWRRRLNDKGVGGILSLWDIVNVGNRTSSLRRLLEKLCTLHNHIRTITRIAWSRRLSPFLDGEFRVVPVPAARGNISIKFSKNDVFPIVFPPEQPAESRVKDEVYNELLVRLRVKADGEGIDLGKEAAPKISMQSHVHAECTLLAYHLQHSDVDAYHYFGGSKLSCLGCATFFSSFNVVASSMGQPQFFTRGSPNKVYLRWPYPFLLSAEQRKRLRPTQPSLNDQVRHEMVNTLRSELAEYVHELRLVAEEPFRTQSDSTDASGDSRGPDSEGIAKMKLIQETGFASSK